MFEFFIALFGGVHYGGKILAESTIEGRAKQAYNAIWSYHQNRLVSWTLDVAAPSLEEDLSHFISNPRNYEEVWKEVHEAYLQMPTYKSYTTILLHEPMVLQYYGKDAYTKRQRENIVEHERGRALSIMLARRGKVCSSGHQDRGVLDLLPKGSGKQSKKVWDETVEFWTYIRNELRRNDVNARLIFKTGVVGEEYNQIAYDVDDVEKFRYQAGQLTWLPLTYYGENLQYMRV